MRIDRERPAVEERYDRYYRGGHAQRLYGVFDDTWRALRGRRTRLITKRARPPGAALDVGCERGDLLRALRSKGFAVHGTQVARAAAEHAWSHYGIEVFVGELQDAPFAAERFDVVTMLNVLEHLEDPRRYVQQVARMTAEGGVFWVEVPNVSSLTARLTGKRWLHHDPDHHLWGFALNALQRLLGEHGFKVEKIYHDGWEYSLIGCIQSWLNFLPGPRNLLFDLVRSGPTPHRLLPQLLHVLLAVVLLPVAVAAFAIETVTGNGQVVLVRARRVGS